MDQLQIYKKPELVLISEKKKLREYSQEEKMGKVANLIFKLLNLLGVNEGKTEHHLVLARHVSDFYGHFSFEQIEKAFGLFIARTFKTKPFQQLNAVVFGQVMAEYSEYEKEQTKIYKMKLKEFRETAEPMPENEKNEYMEKVISNALSAYKDTGDIDMPIPKYDWLNSQGLIQGDMSLIDFNEMKKEKYEIVKNRLIEIYGKAKALSFEDKIQIKKTLKDLQEKGCWLVVAQCKLEMLEDYFNTKIKQL